MSRRSKDNSLGELHEDYPLLDRDDCDAKPSYADPLGTFTADRPSSSYSYNSSTIWAGSEAAVSLKMDILLFLRHHGNGINLPSLVEKCADKWRLKVTPTMYMFIYRLVYKMQAAKYVTISKVDGFIWIVPMHAFYADTPFNLIRALVKLKPSAVGVRSETYVKRHKAWKDCQFLLKYKRLTNQGWIILNSEFEIYKEDVNDKWMIYRHKEVLERYIGHAYTHRFQEEQANKA
ncbi:unnamed protein product, partial [marine sediment metagenome]